MHLFRIKYIYFFLFFRMKLNSIFCRFIALSLYMDDKYSLSTIFTNIVMYLGWQWPSNHFYSNNNFLILWDELNIGLFSLVCIWIEQETFVIGKFKSFPKLHKLKFWIQPFSILWETNISLILTTIFFSSFFPFSERHQRKDRKRKRMDGRKVVPYDIPVSVNFQ